MFLSNMGAIKERLEKPQKRKKKSFLKNGKIMHRAKRTTSINS
ncbi:ATP/GTP-binding domain protein [Helicobacter pylori Hp H-43]|nr:ATP/GTP-binding domain protein [Helicobacter pylori Hp H-43]